MKWFSTTPTPCTDRTGNTEGNPAPPSPRSLSSSSLTSPWSSHSTERRYHSHEWWTRSVSPRPPKLSFVEERPVVLRLFVQKHRSNDHRTQLQCVATLVMASNKRDNLPSAATTNLTWGSTWSTRSGNWSAVKSNSVTSTWCLVKCRFLSTFALIIGKMSPLSMSETVSWQSVVSYNKTQLPVQITGQNIEATMAVKPTPLPSSKMTSWGEKEWAWCNNQSANSKLPRHICNPTMFKHVLELCSETQLQKK